MIIADIRPDIDLENPFMGSLFVNMGFTLSNGVLISR